MPIDRSKLLTPDDLKARAMEELTKTFEIAIQVRLDNTAKQLGYDNINTAISYANEPAVAKFQSEGKVLRKWRSLVWAYCYAELDKVKAGTRPVPELSVFLEELPTPALA